MTADEKIERAFQSDENNEVYNANMEIFHAYMRGGIDWLYEKIIEENQATIEDDYIDNILRIVEEFSEEFEIKE